MNTSILRQERDLSGWWSFQIDQDETGEKGRWFAPSHDRRAWRKVRVPGAWDFYTPELKDYEGVAWYAVKLPASLVKPALYQCLHFASVHNHARVWLNGRFLGEHFGGYLPFEVDITRAVRPGRTQMLILRVDNISKKATVDWLPGTPQPEWVQYGGILRSVKLISTARSFLSDFHIHAVPSGAGARVACELELTNTAAAGFRGRIEVQIRAEAHCCRATTEVACRRRATIRRRVALDLPRVKLWTLEAPVLYEARAALIPLRGGAADAVSDRFGVRTIEVKGGQILLNGRPIVIKGFNRYDELGAHGPTPPAAEIRADLRLLKKSGANLVRVHYPQDPVHHRIMDEIGLLLMEEIPLNWWGPDTEAGKPLTSRDRRIIRRAEEALSQMVRRDRNHPCLAIWSMSNECGTVKEAGAMAMRRLMKRARKLDPTRLVTYVTHHDVAQQRAFSDADMVCMNTYFGLFQGDRAMDIGEFPRKVYALTADWLRQWQSCWPDKPLLITEFGTHGLPGFHGRHRFTEEYQAEYLRTIWDAIRRTPGVAGGVIWAWADYRHQRDFCPKGGSAKMYQAPYGPYGVVSIDRKPKLAYRVMRRIWTGRTPSGGRPLSPRHPGRTQKVCR